MSGVCPPSQALARAGGGVRQQAAVEIDNLAAARGIAKRDEFLSNFAQQGLAFAGAIMLATLAFSFTNLAEQSTVLSPTEQQVVAVVALRRWIC